MFTTNGLLVTLYTIIALSSYASAFFLNWGSPEPIKIQRPTYANYYHYKKYEGVPQSYQHINSADQQHQQQQLPQVQVQVPPVPLQVPLQAQLSPIPNIHNVQLVPCLCPVTPDADYEKYQDSGKNVFVNQIKSTRR